MSEYQDLTILAAFVLAYSLVASRLERTPVNGAIIYVLAGVLFGPQILGLIDLQINDEGVSRLAEFALAVCLFTDSANANLSVLRRVEVIPIRLLLVGLPLTIGLGVGLAWLLFGQLSFVEMALIGAMLAPTDAALGKAVVTNPVVPVKVRESLNVESGLNDGICVPVILFLLAVSGSATGSPAMAMGLFLQVIGIGLVVGLALGFATAHCLRLACDHRWIEDCWIQIPIIAASLLCFAMAQWLGGSGFIASFVGGLTFGALTRQHKDQFLHAAEGTADVLAMLTWFAFGAMMFKELWAGLGWRVLLYAALSLTLIRIVPVMLCLTGRHLRLDTQLFMGWFGPRGLASIVFLVMVLNEKLPGNDTIVGVVIATILLSVVMHGLTANPLAKWYGARVSARGDEI